jgi:arylsulfatase A-like enzyme
LLTQAYASSSICSPTRVGLITGRYPARLAVGLDEPLGARGTDIGLPPAHPTLPSLLRNAGYRTVLLGKWHMGRLPKFGPLKSGYERFFGFHDGFTYYFDRPDNPSPLLEGEERVQVQGYLTDVLGARGVAEIAAAAAARVPLFLSLHFSAPHWPWQGPDDGPGSDPKGDPLHRDGGSLSKYAEMLAALDRNVGHVLDALDAEGLAQDSIVIFTSDNGGERFSDVWPLTGMKGELLEGGIRVPVLMRWPGHIMPGMRSDQVMASIDWLPTLLAAAGVAADPAYPPDGENLLQVFSGGDPPRARTLFWRFKANKQAALRDGNWKYLKIAHHEHLFDVVVDPRERAELKDKHPEVFARLRAEYQVWNARMLPYTSDSVTYDVTGGTADRY